MLTWRIGACIWPLSSPLTCSFSSKDICHLHGSISHPLYSFYLFARASRCHQSLIPKCLSLLGNNTKRTQEVFKTRSMIPRKHVKICLPRLTNITNRKGMSPNRRAIIAGILVLALLGLSVLDLHSILGRTCLLLPSPHRR